MCQVFTDDVATLIELIESKLCLWDKTSDSSKYKIEESKAWREIAHFWEAIFTKGMETTQNK